MHKCMVQLNKTSGNLFVILLIVILGLAYSQLVLLVWGPSLFSIFPPFFLPPTLASTLAPVVLLVWHFLVLMFIWSLFQTLLTDPGRVPIYWVLFPPFF